MAGTIVDGLRAKTDTAYANIARQLQGMEPHLERSDAPGEWTTREVLCHLSFGPGADPVPLLKSFHPTALPLIEITPGDPHLTEEGKKLSLAQLQSRLDGQRRVVFAYLDTLSDAELQSRKARIPLFKQFMQTDEVPLAAFVGALFDYHWNDHAGQLAKIRKAAGLTAA